ncbi:MAG: domain 2 [Planctomycetota bacterium]|jgi:hypothetical protein
MRYWLSIGDGTTYGPFTVEELRTLVAEGRLTASAHLCEENSADWIPAPMVLEGLPPAPVTPPTTPPTSPAGVGATPMLASGRRVSLAASIVATVLTLFFCCLPIGVVPLVMASRANNFYAVGRVTEGEREERNYRTWMTVTWVLLAIGGILFVAQFVLLIPLIRSLPL